MNLGSWLLSLAGPLAARVTAALGVSFVTVTGLTLAVSSLRSLVLEGIGGFPLAAVQLLGLFGIWEALGLVFGCLTFVVSWRTIGSTWRLARAGA
jgi:hypothetical protein